MGVATGDYDNDGDTDLYVTALGPNTLYRNNGNGTFSDVTAAAGVDDPRWSTAATFVDYDRDGDLDLFVANYLDFSVAANKQCFDPAGTRDYCGPRSYRAVPDRLFRNDGGGRFTDVSETAGITKADGAGLGVSTGDYNGDGWLDLYVANDATPNQLWTNQKDGTFVDEGPLAGVALNAAGNPEGSMGVASGDYDRDGDEDLFVTNIIAETFALYTNDGHAGFDDTRVAAGVAQPTAAFTGFGTDWIDYDNDGWLDLFVANGAVNIIEAQRGQPVPYRMRNQLFRNLGNGKFSETSSQGGPAFARAEVGRAAAFGDLDNDGDTDIVVTTSNGPVRLLRNRVGAGASWLQVRLDNGAANRAGLRRAGARRACRRAAAGAPRAHRRQLSDRAGPDAAVWPGRVARPGHRARRLARRHLRAVRGRQGRPARDADARDWNVHRSRDGALATSLQSLGGFATRRQAAGTSLIAQASGASLQPPALCQEKNLCNPRICG